MKQGDREALELEVVDRLDARVVGEVRVVVALGGVDGRDLLELVEHTGDDEVAGVEDQVDAFEGFEDLGEDQRRLGHVGVGEDADPHAAASRRGWAG